jgi:hypothetical protein
LAVLDISAKLSPLRSELFAGPISWTILNSFSGDLNMITRSVSRSFRTSLRGLPVLIGAISIVWLHPTPASAICTSTPCDDLVLIPADGRNEIGSFTGSGACYAYEHRGFDGDRQTTGPRRIKNYVGDDFNDTISSFRVMAGCRIVAWEHRDKGGARTTFYSDTEYVGDDWNDDISSYACRCD